MEVVRLHRVDVPALIDHRPLDIGLRRHPSSELRRRQAPSSQALGMRSQRPTVGQWQRQAPAQRTSMLGSPCGDA